jgi:hypothetical protein
MPTFLDELETALRRAAEYNRNDQSPPAAVLWPDAERAWVPLVPRLRERLPLLTLGEYDPESLTGPAIWVRCTLARTVPEAEGLPAGTPVVYLPGVSRAQVRAVDECPKALQPLAELQYRGVLWTQKNGKDWTLAAFLQSADGGLGIPVAADNATRDSLARSLTELAKEAADALGKQGVLSAAFFDGLLNPDPARALLLWMCDPEGQRNALGAERWASFVATCKAQYGLDPVREGELRAGELLGGNSQAGPWGLVWSRFRESPQRFAGIRQLLDRAQPSQPSLDFVEDAPGKWPRTNQQKEEELRRRLCALADRPAPEARSAVLRLEADHCARREWVWASLGEAPLAGALEHLAALAEATEDTLPAASAKELAEKYAAGGWRADGALLQALSCVENAKDVEAVRAVCTSLYKPWLQDVVEAFQGSVAAQPPAPAPGIAEPGQPPAGTCFLFVDALRFDLAQELCQRLRTNGHEPKIAWRFAPLPTVTATAKLGVSPIASLCKPGKEFSAATESDTSISAAVFRRLLEENGYPVFGEEETGDPSGSGWTETGRFDATGHAEGWRLAHRVGDDLDRLARRVAALVEAGWREVRILTDHGWLLLPGGLPKHDLPEHLTTVRKGRCARLTAGAQVELPTVPWRWDAQARIAVAPGIACFVAGKEYEHGGVSLQECVVPEITVVGSSGPTVNAAVTEVEWSGMRCRVTLSGELVGSAVDIRQKAADAGSSVADQRKTPDEAGKTALFVEDDRLEGSPVVIVLLDASGKVVRQRATIAGGET